MKALVAAFGVLVPSGCYLSQKEAAAPFLYGLEKRDAGKPVVGGGEES